MSEDFDDPGIVTSTFCATLVDEWIRAGVRVAVIAPGSRSTPMALALTARDEIDVQVHHDERAAAFIALGVGRASGMPAVVLTTSGTAAVELHPAIVEAHQSAVPMLVVTADRPPELRGVGAPQTVEQTGLYGSSVRWFAEPGPPVHATVSTWRSLGSRSVIETIDHPAGPGPVHLNLGFREPLVGEPADPPPGRPGGRPWHRAGGHRVALDRRGSALLVEHLDAPRGVIIAGAGCGDASAILSLADATGWPVLADARSGCRLEHPAVVCHADAILREPATAERLRPDVILRLGEPPVSKVLDTWATASAAEQIVVTADARWFDPNRTATAVLRVDPNAVTHALAQLLRHPHTVEWAGRWATAEADAAAAIDRVLDETDEITEPTVARELCQRLGIDDTLVVSSSMPIRDVEWFGGLTDARIRSNRGANGIDGVLSTAIGTAIADRGEPGRTAVLLGDIAFLHDSNALLGLGRRHIDLLVVVVDNDGGGIFSFLPQADQLDTDRFEQLFGTPHGVDLASLCAAHDIPFATVDDPGGLRAALDAALQVGGVEILQVRTDRTDNVEIHRQLDEAVRKSLETG